MNKPEITVSVSHVQSTPGLFPHTHPKIHKKPLKMTHTAGGNWLEKEHGCVVTILVPQKSSCKLHARFQCKLSNDMLALFTASTGLDVKALHLPAAIIYTLS